MPSFPPTRRSWATSRSLLAALAEWAPEGGNWGEKAAQSFRQQVSDALDTPSTGLSPQRAVEVARAVLPRDTIATCDAGASRLLVVQKWQAYGPREFLTSNGLGSMGYAVPGALGARLAHPDRPVVAFTGDGGFLMAVAELQTAQREKLPIIVVVFDDQEIGLIRVKQEIKGIPLHGVKLGGVDWEKLGSRVRRRRDGRRDRAGPRRRALRRRQVRPHHRHRRPHRPIGLRRPVQRAAGAVRCHPGPCPRYPAISGRRSVRDDGSRRQSAGMT